MLTSQSYVFALAILSVAAGLGVWLVGRGLPRRWPMTLRGALVGSLAALLLTPATPGPTATTVAPALVVAVFNSLFGEGWSSAVPAVARLLVAVIAGVAIGAAIGALFGRRLRREPAGDAP